MGFLRHVEDAGDGERDRGRRVLGGLRYVFFPECLTILDRVFHLQFDDNASVPKIESAPRERFLFPNVFPELLSHVLKEMLLEFSLFVHVLALENARLLDHAAVGAETNETSD